MLEKKRSWRKRLHGDAGNPRKRDPGLIALIENEIERRRVRFFVVVANRSERSGQPHGQTQAYTMSRKRSRNWEGGTKKWDVLPWKAIEPPLEVRNRRHAAALVVHKIHEEGIPAVYPQVQHP